MRKYYEAYDERYKTVHLKGVSWSSDKKHPCCIGYYSKIPYQFPR